jgi:hypothetical protein
MAECPSQTKAQRETYPSHQHVLVKKVPSENLVPVERNRGYKEDWKIHSHLFGKPLRQSAGG